MSALTTRTKNSPIPVIKSQRSHPVRALTSLPAGKMVPLAAVPLLREDQLSRGIYRMTFEMSETVEMLMNNVNVRVMAYLVPHLAFARFSGMDELNRSYMGQPNQEGGAVTPYFTTTVGEAHGVNKIHKYLGKHVKPGDAYNNAYVEAYNTIWNHRAKSRSADISERLLTDVTLAPAFWNHAQFNHIVPDFDQAVIDGEVALNVIDGNLPVKQAAGTKLNVDYGTTVNQQLKVKSDGFVTGQTNPASLQAISLATVSNIYAELAANGITVSLSNIDMAKRTQAFALLRTEYSGHSDDYIIDMLMNGLTIPEQAFKQPMLLGENTTVFGMSKRYASDGANLTESVVNGLTSIDMAIRVPTVPMGGVIMLVAEITPEQLFERQADPYLGATTVDVLPSYLRDTLDPEKVVVVPNKYIDTAHTVPTGTFGYAPLNHEWNHVSPCIGGKYFRPSVNTSFDEIRQRIWSVETVDPALSADFYLCNSMHVKPFVDQINDQFEVVVRGENMIVGNTVFGGHLVEGNSEWDDTLAEVPQDRIVKA